jgi:hypothetical protein
MKNEIILGDIHCSKKTATATEYNVTVWIVERIRTKSSTDGTH